MKAIAPSLDPIDVLTALVVVCGVLYILGAVIARSDAHLKSIHRRAVTLGVFFFGVLLWLCARENGRDIASNVVVAASSEIVVWVVRRRLSQKHGAP